jgi:hypothetical protein
MGLFVLVMYKGKSKPSRLMPKFEPEKPRKRRVSHSRQMLHSPIAEPVRTDSWDLPFNCADYRCWKNQKHARKIWMRHLCRIKKSVSHRLPIERCIFPNTHNF